MKQNNRTAVHAATVERPNPHWRLRSLALGFGLVVLGVVMANTRPPAAERAAPEVPAASTALERERLAIPGPRKVTSPRADQPDAAQPARRVEWEEVTIETGDTLAQRLRQAGVSEPSIHRLVASQPHGNALNHVRPGERIRIGVDATGTLQRLIYARSQQERLVFNRESPRRFASAHLRSPLQRRLKHATGVIRTSLFAAGARAGLSDALITDMVGIFAWDIDFGRDVRRGDRFAIVYESFYDDGEHVRDGAIVAAEFVNKGERHRAVHYAQHDGPAAYFAPDGTSMRKAFLRTPVKFTRISSGYGQRYHPVLGRMSNHHGIDYAAAPGTPIRATGAGRIAYRGRNGDYGRFIVIRHGARYSTAYGHMSRFAAGQSTGSRVEQGEVIGYVGNTGLSTGPHLHYEFRINGVHKNPLEVAFPAMDAIPDDKRADFEAVAASLLSKLDTLRRTYAALGR